MRASTQFAFADDLIIVPAIVYGPRGKTLAKLVLDTGATITSLSPAIADAVGYGISERLRGTSVTTAVGKQSGYLVRVTRLVALGLAAREVRVNVADLEYGVDGLLGMSFLKALNFEVRPLERCVLVEPATSVRAAP